jgi:hypothetical protein
MGHISGSKTSISFHREYSQDHLPVQRASNPSNPNLLRTHKQETKTSKSAVFSLNYPEQKYIILKNTNGYSVFPGKNRRDEGKKSTWFKLCFRTTRSPGRGLAGHFCSQDGFGCSS